MLMDRYGAKAILDENSVLLADQSLNITAAVIAEIDAPAGAGRRDARMRTPAPPPARRETTEESERWHWRSTRRCRRPTS